MDVVHIGVSIIHFNVVFTGGLPSAVHHLHGGLLHLAGLPHGGRGDPGILPVSFTTTCSVTGPRTAQTETSGGTVQRFIVQTGS